MTDNSRSKKTKSAQQWAWEFLRRNPTYRDAFQKVMALSPEHLKLIVKYRIDEEDLQLRKEVVRSLDIEFLDTSQVSDIKDIQKTVGEYIDQTQGVRNLLKETYIHLPISKKFKLPSYSLKEWHDPNTDWEEFVKNSMWYHETKVELGLVRAAWADGGKSIQESMEEIAISGWSWSENVSGGSAPIKTDKRRRKSPVRIMEGLPLPIELLRGVDDRVFMQSDILGYRLNKLQACPIFDMSLPIEFQLESIRAFLEQHQKDLVQSGFIQRLPKQADKFRVFEEYLKILDRLDADDRYLDIAMELDGLTTIKGRAYDAKAKTMKLTTKVVNRTKPGASVNELTQSVRKKIERAIHLRDHGYRALAFSK